MKGIATVLGLLLVALPAHADATLEVIRTAGLLGTWAESCSAGPSRQNWFVTFYVTTNATVRRKGVRGSDDPVLDGTVDSAERLTPTTVRIRLRNDDPNWGDANGAIYDAVVEIKDGKSHAVTSVRSDGTPLIKDGTFVASGNPTPVLQRCN
jgi:hypothetical protein